MSVACQEIARELFSLQPDARPVAAVPARRLPPLYYLHNFRLALAMLEERYGGLLSVDEADFIEQFRRLPQAAQCLLTRLVMRKGPLFRRATLQYADVADLEPALQELVALRWLDPDPRLSSDELFGVLTSQELRLAVGTTRGRRSGRVPLDLKETQLALPLHEQPPVRRSLGDWSAHLAGGVVQLCVDPLVDRLQQLFFGNHHQTWAEFVLSDLGVSRYESVAVDSHSRAFQTREEIAHFYRLNECRARLDAGEPPDVVRESAVVPLAVCGWLGVRFGQLQLRIGELLEAQGNVEPALQSYRDCGAVEGLVRAVRLQVRLGRHEAAHRDALTAQTLSRSEFEQQAVERALARATRVRRKPHEPTETIELELPRVDKRHRVELAVVEQLATPGAPAFYVENSLFPSLFGLLCWEALFAPLPGAFFHPFQSGPADLHTREFRGRRADQFETLLGLLDAGRHEAVMRETYRVKTGIRSNFVRWGKLRPSLLTLALQCIPTAHLRACFERLLDDLKENTTGMPDLIQFWPAERRYRLIEVKGPGDRLQDNQRRWLAFFKRHEIPAAVCQVRWQPAARQAGTHAL